MRGYYFLAVRGEII